MRFAQYLMLMVCMLFTSCEEEKTYLPAYIQDLGEIKSDTQGYAQTLTLDQGEILQISNQVGSLKADTITRVRALYQKLENQSIWLSSIASVLTPHLAHIKQESRKTDPVTLIACWKGQNYINFRLDIAGTTQGKHIFGFHENNLFKNPDGSQRLQAILLHDRNGDPEYYTRETFISLPLRPLQNRLQAGRDTIEIDIPTYKGWEIKKIAF